MSIFNPGPQAQAQAPGIFVPLETRLGSAGDKLCGYCFVANTKSALKFCSGCKRISYCSTKCQQQDWKVGRHKLFCPLQQKRNEYDRVVIGDRPVDFDEMWEHQVKRTAILSGRDPNTVSGDLYTTAIVKFEVMCAICLRTPFQKTTFTKFLSCPACNAFYFCSEECKSKQPQCHSKSDCDALKLLESTERVEIDWHLKDRFPYKLQRVILLSPRPRRRHRPLSTCAGWEEYDVGYAQDYGHNMDDGQYDEIIDITKTSVPRPLARQALALLIQEGLSIPFTIIQALEQTIPDVSKRSSLEIHVIGAADREYRGKLAIEEILHHFPLLRKLTIRYIGPEVPERGTMGRYEPDANWACPECTPRGSQRFTTIHSVPYHVFTRSREYSKPDLIVGFNTGMSEVDEDSWEQTRAVMASMKIPAVFTSYTWPEAMMERDLFKHAGFCFLVDVQRNKWRSVIPRIHFGCGRRDGLLGVYNSRYWYVVGGNTVDIVPKTAGYKKNQELD